MYKKIMVPLDGSSLAECVVPHIETIAKPCSSHVELVSVVEPMEIPTRGKIALSDDDIARIDKEIKDDLHDYLDSLVDRFKRAGIKARHVILSGKPADSLIEYARDNHIDLVIMATHGRSGITKWFWGSIAEKVLRAIDIPVLLVKTGECESE